ncbi:MAG: ABC transporter ATP-binding protein [Cyanobacteria bacterium P01_D01_bin.105]
MYNTERYVVLALLMADSTAIALKDVSKLFKRYHRPVDRLKELLLPGKQRADEFWALRDIDLEIEKGKTVGIIGRNGSGKSTLLQIVAGTLQPTTGDVSVSGRVSALLELGSGFNPEFTGRQNVFFNGRILGLNQADLEAKFDEIVSFADIGGFIDQPVKTYSSGMYVRLAFSVAVHIEPEVLIVDEALSVGDIIFQHKCMQRIRKLMDSGVTTLFVSHDTHAVKSLCQSAVLLENGNIYAEGKPSQVFIKYMELSTNLELEQSRDKLSVKATADRETSSEQPVGLLNRESQREFHPSSSWRGSGHATIDSVYIFHENGDAANRHPDFAFDEKISVVVEIEINTPLDGLIVGFFVCDKNGNEILGSNTQEENVPIEALDASDKISVTFVFTLPLRVGSYSLTVACAENYTNTTCDWIDSVEIFKVKRPQNGKNVTALVDIPMTISSKKIDNTVSTSLPM